MLQRESERPTSTKEIIRDANIHRPLLMYRRISGEKLSKSKGNQYYHFHEGERA